MFCNVAFAYTALGSVSCGTIISIYEEDASVVRSMVIPYISGYFTGRNYETDGVVGRKIDKDSTFHALMKYCRENPLKKNHNAVEYIYQELKFLQ